MAMTLRGVVYAYESDHTDDNSSNGPRRWPAGFCCHRWWRGRPARKRRSIRSPLGKTGLKLSRLGIGCGTSSGRVQQELGQEGFNRLVRYAYDQGITFFDIARSYRTHTMLGEAIKGLPREKLFIQTKMGGTPDNPLEEIDRYRKAYGVDYIDSLLVHCTITPNWDERAQARHGRHAGGQGQEDRSAPTASPATACPP